MKFLNRFLNDYRHIPPLALDNSHPGPNAHKAIADAYYEAIQNNDMFKH